jgi:hypothetical protein
MNGCGGSALDCMAETVQMQIGGTKDRLALRLIAALVWLVCIIVSGSSIGDYLTCVSSVDVQLSKVSQPCINPGDILGIEQGRIDMNAFRLLGIKDNSECAGPQLCTVMLLSGLSTWKSRLSRVYPCSK